MTDINDVFLEYSKEQQFLTVSEMKKWIESFYEILRQDIINGHLSEAFSDKVTESQVIDILNIIWNPNLNWDISYRPEYVSVSNVKDFPSYGTVVRIYVSLKTSLNDIITQFENAAKAIAQVMPKRLMKCSDDVFLREFYERVFQYSDEEKQKEIKKFIERRFDAEFLDYEDEYLDKGYFDIHHTVGESGTTGLALVNKRDGSIIHKGDYVVSDNIV